MHEYLKTQLLTVFRCSFIRISSFVFQTVPCIYFHILIIIIIINISLDSQIPKFSVKKSLIENDEE